MPTANKATFNPPWIQATRQY